MSRTSQKPELVICSQYLLGGGTSFHRNMMAQFPRDYFSIRCIYLNPIHWDGAKALAIELGPDDKIISYGDESERVIARRIADEVTDGEGVVVVDLEIELISLDLFRNPSKTIFFVCHDDGFINMAIKYETIIDVFISHNIAVYRELQIRLPQRSKDMHFIPHGVVVPSFQRTHHPLQRLEIVFLARHYEFKGIYDLPLINDFLVKSGIEVGWTILGDGPEREKMMEKVKLLQNFQFCIPQSTEDVLDILKTKDVFILPSRKDGLPVALLESMSVGCVPLLAAFSEGIKEVVTPDIGFVVGVGDIIAFAEKINLLSADRQLLNTLSARCIERVRTDFDITKQALKYFHLYRKHREFKREHPVDLTVLFRILSSYSFFKKFTYVWKNIRHKMGLN